jgi:glutamyl endopeptidase
MNHVNYGLAITLMTASFQVFAADSDSLANDGSIPEPAVISGNLIDNGYVGTGNTVSLLALGADTQAMTTTELQRIARLAPSLPNAEANTAPRAVLGLDTRVQLKPAVYPYRAIALITTSGARCTGWMVGADTVITAGHCVHRGSTGSWYNLNDYIIYPGHDGTNANYGSCKAKRLYTTEGWALGSKPEYDYAAIKLNCQVGQATGWLGFAAPTTTKNLPAIISAYPGDKPLGQWVGFDSIKKEDSNWTYYKNDTYSGMSGAPVWYDAGKRALAFAIHTYRVPNFNRGARINSEVFKNIKTWKNAQ